MIPWEIFAILWKNPIVSVAMLPVSTECILLTQNEYTILNKGNPHLSSIYVFK